MPLVEPDQERSRNTPAKSVHIAVAEEGGVGDGRNANKVARALSRDGGRFRRAIAKRINESDPNLDVLANEFLRHVYAMSPWAIAVFLKVFEVGGAVSSDESPEVELGYEDEE